MRHSKYSLKSDPVFQTYWLEKDHTKLSNVSLVALFTPLNSLLTMTFHLEPKPYVSFTNKNRSYHHSCNQR